MPTGRKKGTPQSEQSPGTARRSSTSHTPRATPPGTTPRASSTTPRTPASAAPSPPVKMSPRASAPAASPRRSTAGDVFASVGKLKMRAACELDSDEAGSLAPGTRVVILERSELSDGTKRARVGKESNGVPLGWVSCVAKDGRDNLEPITKASPSGVAKSSTNKAPPSTQNAASLPFAGLPPTSASSGALTARSTAKATATAGAAKSVLPSEAIAAAEAAALEAVAAQTAAAQAAAKARSDRTGLAMAPAPAAALAAAMSARNVRPPIGGSPVAGSRFHSSASAAPGTPGRASSPATPGRSMPNTPGRSPATPGRAARGGSSFAAR